jgi:hypothetical protein
VPTYTRLTLFTIPFRIERPDRVAQEPAEVQLFVSGDRGAHWDSYAKVEPSKHGFLFRAGADGEYWFCIRTIDRSGQVRPQGPYTPGLKVIVDTAAPKVQFDARRGDAGQITAAFQIEEPYPKFDALSIQYRIGPNARWQTVAMSPQDIHSTGISHRGEVTWWPPSAGTMEIRVEITDLAGNPAVSHAQINLSENRTATTGAQNPQNPLPGDGRGVPPSPAGSDSRYVTASPQGPFPGGIAQDTSRAGDAWRPSSSEPTPMRWPAENAHTVAKTEMSLASVDGRKLEPTTSSVAIRVNPAIRNQYVAPDDKTAAAMKSGVRWVNSRVFELDYDARSNCGELATTA